jgi:hypothetical protein
VLMFVLRLCSGCFKGFKGFRGFKALEAVRASLRLKRASKEPQKSLKRASTQYL